MQIAINPLILIVVSSATIRSDAWKEKPIAIVLVISGEPVAAFDWLLAQHDLHIFSRVSKSHDELIRSVSHRSDVQVRFTHNADKARIPLYSRR